MSGNNGEHRPTIFAVPSLGATVVEQRPDEDPVTYEAVLWAVPAGRANAKWNLGITAVGADHEPHILSHLDGAEAKTTDGTELELLSLTVPTLEMPRFHGQSLLLQGLVADPRKVNIIPQPPPKKGEQGKLVILRKRLKQENVDLGREAIAAQG